MNKSSNSNPEQVVAMSTKVFNFIIDAYVFIWWALLCNPFSMALIHWIKPKLASALAHDKLFCGDDMLAFYTKLARKWPFKWSKWWLSPQDLKNYTAEQQITYFLKVNGSQEVLDILPPEAIKLLVKNYPEKVKAIIKEMRIPDEMFSLCLKSEFVEELPVYIKRGTLPKEQIVILMDRAIRDGKFTLQSEAMLMFLNYAERCGLSKELRQKFFKEAGAVGYIRDIMHALLSYDQKCAVRQFSDFSFADSKSQWKRYLKEQGKLLIRPSLEMTPEQYDIFHEVGLHLYPEATLAFLKRDLPEMHRRIFRYEPNHGIVNDYAANLIAGNHELQVRFKLTVEEQED